tara:strand:- start:47 stop:601 length:555 start_codon:yes stop_codon:yes gene_type:complete
MNAETSPSKPLLLPKSSSGFFLLETAMARPTIRTSEMIDEILDRISVGETMTSICKDDRLPTIRALMKWLRKDKELDDQMHRARVRGTLIQADEAVDAQRSVIAGTTGVDPKCVQAVVTAANNMGHQANAKLSKIDTRYKDKQQVEYTGPMVIGWEDSVEVEDKVSKTVGDRMLNAVTNEDTVN